VDLRVKSNINKIAAASLQTKGSMFTNSLCPVAQWRVSNLGGTEATWSEKGKCAQTKAKQILAAGSV
jgi:hypothetical protein